jgi:hypothetical protein
MGVVGRVSCLWAVGHQLLAEELNQNQNGKIRSKWKRPAGEPGFFLTFLVSV